MYNITVVPPWTREYKRSDRPLYQQVIQKWKKEEPLLANEEFNWVYDGGKTLYSTKHLQNTDKKTWIVKVRKRDCCGNPWFVIEPILLMISTHVLVKVRETMEAEQEREFTIKDFGMVKENCQNNHLYKNIFPQVKRIPVSQDLAEWAARGRSGGVPQVFFQFYVLGGFHSFFLFFLWKLPQISL